MTRVTCDPTLRSNGQIKITRPINAEMENVPYLRKERPMNFKLGILMEYNELHHLHAR